MSRKKRHLPDLLAVSQTTDTNGSSAVAFAGRDLRGAAPNPAKGLLLETVCDQETSGKISAPGKGQLVVYALSASPAERGPAGDCGEMTTTQQDIHGAGLFAGELERLCPFGQIQQGRKRPGIQRPFK